MSNTFSIVISPYGSIRMIYRDDMRELLGQGVSKTQRAGYVEPSPEVPGNWDIDLSLSGGPKTFGFQTRQEALDLEISWLENQLRT